MVGCLGLGNPVDPGSELPSSFNAHLNAVNGLDKSSPPVVTVTYRSLQLGKWKCKGVICVLEAAFERIFITVLIKRHRFLVACSSVYHSVSLLVT